MKLILVRHGETEWVREGRYQGSTDVPLNRRGLRQARAVARRLQKEKPIAVYSSELTRARETAKLIASACRKSVFVDKRLNEVSFGSWEGKSHRDVGLRFPELARRWYQAKWSSRPPKGESLQSLDLRISRFLKELLEKYRDEDKTCVIVTHGGPIRMFLIHILKVMPEVFWTFRIDPASISVIHFGKGNREISLLNGQAHLNGLHHRQSEK
ncbi:MAG: alpha-ribazole phosphatase [Candidatus Omnitrophica bacterium]|nr:alpha-ribazole phosphatase [Candidatus Omnitrophota bacterium]